jgi:hypothetical protein
MSPVIACLKSYVAAWWMKVIAAGVVLAAANAVIFLKPTTIFEPAWPHPQLVSWYRLGLAGGAGRSEMSAAEIENVWVDADFFTQPADTIRSAVSQMPNLQACRIELPLESRLGQEAEAAGAGVDLFLTEAGRRPRFAAVDLHGQTPIAVLEPLRGSSTIRAIYTSDLFALHADSADDWFASLVDTVIALPAVEVWGLPRDVSQRLRSLDPGRLEKLRQHPSLCRLLVPPRGLALGLEAGPLCAELFPRMAIGVSHVDRGRLSAAWGILAATMFVAGLVVVSVAGMLVLSSATLVPGYAQAHRRAMAMLLVAITAVAAVCLWRVQVAMVPAVLWAALSAVLPAAVLEWDRRRMMPGILVLPASLAWCLAFIVPLSIVDRGWWWVWLDTFLAANQPTGTTWLVTVAVGVLAVISWRAFGCYAVSLAAHGRTSAVTATRSDVWQQLGRVGGHESLKGASQLWGPTPVIARKALRLDRLCDCDTPAGCRRLLAEGMLALPVGRVLLQGVIILVLAPLMMRLTVPAFRENLQLLLLSLAGIAVVGVWMQPVMLWQDRAARIPGEIGSLLPRQAYLAAMRGLLMRQMRLPAVVLVVVAGGWVGVQTGQWWTLLPLAAVAVALAVITVSVIELLLTVRAALARAVVAGVCVYAAIALGGLAFGVLLNINRQWPPVAPGNEWLKLLPFGLLAVMAIGLRVWMNRRLSCVEFGRLV